MTRELHPLFFFSRAEKKIIREAIEKAELKSSGEIRVHLTKKANDDIIAHAATIFESIGMANTKERNGVLILFSLTDHRFAIIGDAGVNEKNTHLWTEAVALMEDHFTRNEVAEGIVAAINNVGAVLAMHFPRAHNDVNELSDDISIDR